MSDKQKLFILFKETQWSMECFTEFKAISKKRDSLPSFYANQNTTLYLILYRHQEEWINVENKGVNQFKVYL